MTPYSGPVEALTFEEAATRIRVSIDTLRRYYNGPVTLIGDTRRISAHHLHEWLDSCSSRKTVANPWDDDDAEEAALQERKAGQAA